MPRFNVPTSAYNDDAHVAQIGTFGTMKAKAANCAEAGQETPLRPVGAAQAHQFPAAPSRASRRRLKLENQVDDKD